MDWKGDQIRWDWLMYIDSNKVYMNQMFAFKLHIFPHCCKKYLKQLLKS